MISSLDSLFERGETIDIAPEHPLEDKVGAIGPPNDTVGFINVEEHLDRIIMSLGYGCFDGPANDFR